MLNRRTMLAVPAAAAALVASFGNKVAQAASNAAAVLDVKIDPDHLSDKDFRKHDLHMKSIDLESTQDFLTGFRKFLGKEVTPMARGRADAYIASKGLAKDAAMTTPEAYAFMLGDPVYAWSSRLSVTTQQLTWQTLQDHMRSNADYYMTEMEKADKSGPGTLELNPDMHIPEYTRHEIHIQPGGYVGDAFAGHIYHRGTKNFYYEENDHDEIHAALAQQLHLPADGKVSRVLDLGCGVGQLTTAVKDRFPNADVWGIDVGGPMVRYSHLRAVKMDSNVHFAQRLAEDTKFPDNHFDVVTSYIMFHEVTAEAAKKIIAEAHRILRPGGVFMPFDFVMPFQGKEARDKAPQTILSQAGSYASSRMNGEPFIPQHRPSEFPAIMQAAGFNVNQNLTAVRQGRPFSFPTLVATKTA